MSLRYISLSAEQAPWSRSGGLAEVAGSLPSALVNLWAEDEATHPVEASSVSPLYPCVWREVARRGARLTPGQSFSLEPISDQRAQLWTLTPPSAHEGDKRPALKHIPALKHVFIDIPWAFDREHLYGPPGGAYPDNPLRYACLCLAVIRWLDDLAQRDLMGGEEVETVIHCHDWQASYLPIYQRLGWGALHARTLFTIHNLMHQGLCSSEWVPKLGFDWSSFHMNFLEHWGQLNPLKGALSSVHQITTVSPSYAQELLTPQFSCGLDTFLEANKLQVHGVLNGLDLEAWSPYDSPLLNVHLPRGLSGHLLDEALDGWKGTMKRHASPELFPAVSETGEEAPLAILISRFDIQKGIELMIEAAEAWLTGGGRLFILGSGEPEIEAQVCALAERHPGRCAVKIGFDLTLAHQLFAAADLCIIPSRFEPCGLTQMQAMRYGALPLATPVGGLLDSITPLNRSSGLESIERGNGLLCREVSAEALSEALSEALELWRQPTAWRSARKRALNSDWSWSQSAQQWRALIEGQRPLC